MVLMTRVDCRLLHGQTAVSWTYEEKRIRQ